MKKLLFFILFVSVLQLQSLIASLECQRNVLSEISHESLDDLQKQIKPYTQYKKNETKSDLATSMMEQGRKTMACRQPQLDALYKNLENYKERIAQYNLYVRTYNHGHHAALYTTLSDSTIISSLKLSDDMASQLQKHARVLIANQNISPLWQIKQSIQSWGLLYGTFVGTFSFLKNLCMPKNIHTYRAATLGFLGAFTLLKTTPKSDVNNSVVKTSLFCLGGSAATVAAMQLYDSCGAVRSQDQLTMLNGILDNKNLVLFNSFRSLDQQILAMEIKQKVDRIGQNIDTLTCLTTAQHLQGQEQLAAHGRVIDRVEKGQNDLKHIVKNGFEDLQQGSHDLSLSVDALAGELSSNKEHQDARFDSVERQFGKLNAIVIEINKQLQKMNSRMTISAEQLSEYFTRDAKDHESFMSYLSTEFGDIKSALVYQIMQSSEILALVRATAQVQGFMNNHQPQTLQPMLYKSIKPSCAPVLPQQSRATALQCVRQWNAEQRSHKNKSNFLANSLCGRKEVQASDLSKKQAQASAALLIQTALRKKFARKKVAQMRAT
ncbi:hypothetical protein KBC04_01405 [Candidatus Babeliales bacterium]|nr:hypothetical protein [Candidatus Babeliales bacterium]MBP9843623.1 hypothetical protein [Candidatus Babeliales bacterium]